MLNRSKSSNYLKQFNKAKALIATRLMAFNSEIKTNKYTTPQNVKITLIVGDKNCPKNRCI